jgi:hypothetical protein
LPVVLVRVVLLVPVVLVLRALLGGQHGQHRLQKWLHCRLLAKMMRTAYPRARFVELFSSTSLLASRYGLALALPILMRSVPRMDGDLGFPILHSI